MASHASARVFLRVERQIDILLRSCSLAISATTDGQVRDDPISVLDFFVEYQYSVKFLKEVSVRVEGTSRGEEIPCIAFVFSLVSFLGRSSGSATVGYAKSKEP